MIQQRKPQTYTAPRGAGGKPVLAGRALTAAIIRDMQPGDELADPEHPGLRVRKPGTGNPVFFYRYRAPLTGALKQISVGVLGRDMTLASIRKEWENLRDSVRNGKDPRQLVKVEKVKAVERRRADRAAGYTLGDAVDTYLADIVDPGRKEKGAAETRRMLTRAIASYKDMPLARLTNVEAHALIQAVAKTAPRVAAMARQELRACWAHSLTVTHLTAANPFLGKTLGGKFKAKKRERTLTASEAGALLRWVARPGTYSRTVRDALELTLRTGLRSGEVCGIHTRELSERNGVLWLDIPADRMKEGKAHSVPLVGRAAAIVRARLPDGAGFLFPSRAGDKPIQQKALGVEVYASSGRSKARAYAGRQVCPVKDWAPHDLRRTARTLLQDLGCPFEVGEAILAHELPGVSATYARSKFEPEKVEWLTRLGQHLDQLAEGAK